MLPITLLSLVWFPQFGGMAEVAHDVGANSRLRGTIDLGLSMDLVENRSWALEIMTSNRTIVRENTRRETVVRVSPEQVYYRVGARMRFPLAGQRAWALFAHHQSNHDVDSDDQALNRETISYEIYGVELLGKEYTVGAGIYYDRGTRLDGRKQYWPFDYYLAGSHGRLNFPLGYGWYTALNCSLIVHRNPETPLPYAHVSGELDVGWRYPGLQGEFRGFLRGSRVADYQFLGDQPEHLILLGISIRSLSYSQ